MKTNFKISRISEGKVFARQIYGTGMISRMGYLGMPEYELAEEGCFNGQNWLNKLENNGSFHSNIQI